MLCESCSSGRREAFVLREVWHAGDAHAKVEDDGKEGYRYLLAHTLEMDGVGRLCRLDYGRPWGFVGGPCWDGRESHVVDKLSGRIPWMMRYPRTVYAVYLPVYTALGMPVMEGVYFLLVYAGNARHGEAQRGPSTGTPGKGDEAYPKSRASSRRRRGGSGVVVVFV